MGMSTLETTATNPPSATRPPRWRIVTSRILLIVFCLSTVLTVPALWLRNQINDTDRYVRTVAPLASDPAIRTALSNRVATLISAQLDVIVARDGLIDRDFLVAPLASVLADYVNGTVRTFIMLDRFPAIWEAINRTAHPAVSALMTGGGTGSLSTNGQVTLDLSPLVVEITKRLRERGISIVERVPVDQLDTTFVLYQSQALVDVQAGVGMLENLAIWLPAVVLVSFVGSLALSINRRQTLLSAGLGMAGAMAIVLMLLAFARWWSVNQLPPGVNRDAATAFFHTIGRYPRDAARLLSLLGLLVAAAVFVTRPGGSLRRSQKEAWRSVKAAWRAARARWPEVDKVTTWSNEHLLGLAVGLGVVCCLLVIASDPLGMNRARAVLVILAIGYGALWLLRASKGKPAVAFTGRGVPFDGDRALVAAGYSGRRPAAIRSVLRSKAGSPMFERSSSHSPPNCRPTTCESCAASPSSCAIAGSGRPHSSPFVVVWSSCVSALRTGPPKGDV